MPVLALDIGGANLKAADALGNVVSRSFELWRQPDRLAEELAELIAEFSDADTLAVTMTAELCDCYTTKRQGVLGVLGAIERVSGGRTLQVWQTDLTFVSSAAACRDPTKVAAANWMALAEFACRFCREGSGLLIDVGSTTTDLIPLGRGVPVPLGRTDTGRLAAGELVYSGVRRTPVFALVSQVPWKGQECPVAAEWFATTYDVYLTLGDLSENADDQGTADGRPATRGAARERLARVICADREVFSHEDARVVAEAVGRAQMERFERALDRILDRLGKVPKTVVLSGEGEFLARRLATRVSGDPKIVSLAEEFSPVVSKAACAYALAVIAEERRGSSP